MDQTRLTILESSVEFCEHRIFQILYTGPVILTSE